MKNELLKEINSKQFSVKVDAIFLNMTTLSTQLNAFLSSKKINLETVLRCNNSTVERNLLRYAKDINLTVLELTGVNIATRYLTYWSSLIGDYEIIKEGNGNGLDLLSLVESVNDHHSNEIEIVNELNQIFINQ